MLLTEFLRNKSRKFNVGVIATTNIDAKNLEVALSDPLPSSGENVTSYLPRVNVSYTDYTPISSYSSQFEEEIETLKEQVASLLAERRRERRQSIAYED